MQSNLSAKIVDTVRKASRFLIRDFYEVDRLASSSNVLQFVETSCSRTERLIRNEFNNALFKTLMPDNYNWLITPIEGKINFLHGVPYFCILVTLFVNNVPEITVVDAPIFKETYSIEKGAGVNLQDLNNVFRLRVGRTSGLRHAFICSNHLLDLGAGYFRCFGSNFLSLVSVASGKFDAFIFKLPEKNREHVISTFNLVMSESKGKSTVKNGFIIASNVELHQELCSKV